MIKGVIFDMDGVMIDSERQSTLGWLDAAKQMKVEMPMWLIDSFKGAPAELSAKLFDEYYKGCVDFWEMRQLRTEYVYKLRETEGVPVKPGLHSLLEYIRKSGLKCAVATSTRRQSAENSLHVIGAWEYLDAVVYGDEVENGKPAPDIFLRAAQAIGIEPEACVVIEDSINGIKAGYAANMKVVHIPDTIVIGEDIRTLTSAVYDELGGVIGFIKDHNICGIDRSFVKSKFAAYVSQYDLNDDKVKLKVEHTYRVADISEKIAKSLKMDDKDIELAWLLGMFHDIGRFEQLRRYGTFYDDISVNHAALSADILFGNEAIMTECDVAAASKCASDSGAECGVAAASKYASDRGVECGVDNEFQFDMWKNGIVGSFIDVNSIWIKDNLQLMELAVRCHNMYRLPEMLNEREAVFANILRDADKLDILRVCVEEPVEAVYAETEEAMKNSQISSDVMEAFFEEKAVLKALRKTAVDKMVGHISLVFELVYPESVKLAGEQGYLDRLLNFTSDNTNTREQFSKIRAKIYDFMKSL